MNQDEKTPADNSLTQAPLSADPEIARKVTDILIENLKEALKSIDLSIALAFTCVVFLLMHGLQEDFTREVAAAKARAAESKSTIESPAATRTTSDGLETTIPFFGFQAKLLTASMMAVTLFWVFCLRAAFRSRQANLVAQRLARAQDEIGQAVLLYPSLATASKKAKIALCIVLGLLGSAAFFFMYLPLERPWGQRLFSAAFMLLPAAYLCWHILDVPTYSSSPMEPQPPPAQSGVLPE